MIHVLKYADNQKEIWNDFSTQSKAPLFMFNRNYMDYHNNRFKDHSLMFYKDDELFALLPLSEHSDTLISHGGLTYGGFITNNKMKQTLMLECFSALINYAKALDFKYIIYKTVPYIYHEQPAEEDRYGLFLNHAEQLKVEASTVINLCAPLKMGSLRKRQISKAKKQGIIVEEMLRKDQYDEYIDLINKVLATKHNTLAVHSSDELFLLHNRFPDNIRLFGATLNNKLIAGTVIFEYGQIVHTQYLGADETARKVGALDLIIGTLIEKYQNDKLWLDFGISTEENGMLLNEGLIAQKEGFGGRTNVYETYRIIL